MNTGFDGRAGKKFDRFIFAFFKSICHQPPRRAAGRRRVVRARAGRAKSMGFELVIRAPPHLANFLIFSPG